MTAYEFYTKVNSEGHIVIPPEYVPDIPADQQIRVLLLVPEPAIVPSNGHDEDLGHGSLEDLVKQIKNTPVNLANIRPGDMKLLAERLANPVAEPDHLFDAAEWNQQWDQLEAELEAAELADSEARLREMSIGELHT